MGYYANYVYKPDTPTPYTLFAVEYLEGEEEFRYDIMTLEHGIITAIKIDKAFYEQLKSELNAKIQDP